MKYVLGTVPELFVVAAQMGALQGYPAPNPGADPLWCGNWGLDSNWTTLSAYAPFVTATEGNVPNPAVWAMPITPELEQYVPGVTLVDEAQVTLYVPPNPDEF